jgi:hypothetical protein
VVGLFAFGSAAIAQAQGSSGSTSGPAAGSNVKPPTGQDTSGVAGPAGSKNGPAARTDPAPGSTAGNEDDAFRKTCDDLLEVKTTRWIRLTACRHLRPEFGNNHLDSECRFYEQYSRACSVRLGQRLINSHNPLPLGALLSIRWQELGYRFFPLSNLAWIIRQQRRLSVPIPSRPLV